ncbi:MAG: chromate transporter, partial [Lachnospiraceae bacterium]|nr:chromate transporter [Lachnospiraceae bacterium]
MRMVWNVFLVFLKIGLLSIGGGYAVIPLIQEQVVDSTGLISEQMFTDIITISQMTPGPLAVNTSTFVGL